MDFIIDNERPLGMSVEDLIEASAVLVGRDAAVAAIELFDGTVVTGESKRSPGDPFQFHVAHNLALGRALEAVGLLLQEEALAASICSH